MDPAVVKAYWQSLEVQRSMKRSDQGAATTVWAAVSREWEGKGGQYLEDLGLGKPAQDPPLPLSGYAPYVFDAEGAARLWTESLRIVGMTDKQ